MSVLIVDDNARMRAMIRTIVDPMDGVIFEAADAAEAVRLYRRLRPEWVLMDVQMGAADGINATRQIRASDPHAKVIIVTDYDDAATRVAAEDAGAYGFVPKDTLNQLRGLLTRPEA
jgi:DNA-binding NarL/FixJ family response regulator